MSARQVTAASMHLRKVAARAMRITPGEFAARWRYGDSIITMQENGEMAIDGNELGHWSGVTYAAIAGARGLVGAGGAK